jgi:hypothetical protein
MNLEEMIIDECDPCEVVDRLDLTTEDIVRAFSLRIYLQQEAFEDLRGYMEEESMYNEVEYLERDEDPIEEELFIEDMNEWGE